MTAYYNEIDEYAAQWLRNLIAAGHIAPGDVDTRSITEVHPDDIKNYTQCHFFAGIGVWSYALRRAGWADSRPVWTGSCPCQPFSTAGKGAGFDDERHLWPVFGNLIRERRPTTVFGEQVASKDADAWIDLVQADLEAMGYAVGAVPFPAAGIGAPHIRDRLYWMARDLRMGDSGCAGLEGHHRHGGDWDEPGRDNAQPTGPVGEASGFSRVVFAAECIGPTEDDVEYIWIDGELYGKRLADTDSKPILPCGSRSTGGEEATLQGFDRQRKWVWPDAGAVLGIERTSTCQDNSFWRDADWLLCRDGKWRPVEPSTFPLAHGITNRVGRLRAYGNAICAEAAVEFIKVAMEYQP